MRRNRRLLNIFAMIVIANVAGAPAAFAHQQCVSTYRNNIGRLMIENTCNVPISIKVRGDRGCRNWCSVSIRPGGEEITPIYGGERYWVRACQWGKWPYDNPDGTYFCQ